VAAKIRPALFGLLAVALLAGVVMLIARRPAGQPVEIRPPPPTPTIAPMRVHVSGEVVRPGVYAFQAGSIVQDAVEAAGGPTGLADLESLNLAAPLAEGQQVFVPAVGEPPLPDGESQTFERSSLPSPDARININTATAEELEALPEIGPVMAAKIVAYRTTHGPFETIEDIQDVDGIGPKTFEAIKDLIEVGG
jgi:competence protein ComEA